MRDPSELVSYDQMYEKIQLMRVIAYGAFSILEDRGPEIDALLQKQKQKELRSTFSDLGTAILLMWEIVMQDPEESAHNLTLL